MGSNTKSKFNPDKGSAFCAGCGDGRPTSPDGLCRHCKTNRSLYEAGFQAGWRQACEAVSIAATRLANPSAEDLAATQIRVADDEAARDTEEEDPLE